LAIKKIFSKLPLISTALHKQAYSLQKTIYF
jgi:hypothetical protein